MLRVAEDAQSTRRDTLLIVLRDGLEHAVVPVIRLEEAADGEIRSLRHQQHTLACLQLLGNLVCQLVGHYDFTLHLAQVAPRRVDPEVVGVVVGHAVVFCSLDGE